MNNYKHKFSIRLYGPLDPFHKRKTYFENKNNGEWFIQLSFGEYALNVGVVNTSVENYPLFMYVDNDGYESKTTTTNSNDPRLKHNIDFEPVPQQEVYLVLSKEERKKGFVRPYRNKYVHKVCGVETVMGRSLSETYVRNPAFYSATYCVGCKMHKPVSEFLWSLDNQEVGS